VDSPSGQFFDLGDVQFNARLVEGRKLPVVLLSHGTGGSPEGMGWLARALAQSGHLVIGAHHHGNTASERYRPEGFLCWWERAADLSALLTILSEQGPFAGRLNLGRVSAIGFSLGAYAVLALTGATTSMERYLIWASQFPAFQRGPREMPDAADHIPMLTQTSAPFRFSWARQSNSFLDERIRAVIAIAPPPSVRGFDPATVAAIRTPVTLITGGADTEAPSQECADWLRHTNPSLRGISVGSMAGHYTFLGLPGPAATPDDALLFHDNRGVSRAEVHRQVVKEVSAILT
jgi:predicted dienelactone hydrolase